MDGILRVIEHTFKRVRVTVGELSVQFQKHRALLYNFVLAAAAILLLTVTVYTALKTSDYFSTNSDAIVATHQFSKGVESNTVALPGSHSNVIMMPVLYVQGHLPYRYKSFTAVNVGLILLTVFAWALLLIRLFGRMYEILVLVLLACLLFASTTFTIGIGNTTFRNIGFPIALWFVLIIGRLLKQNNYTRNDKLFAAAGSLLFCVLLAGDSFFNYAIILPILLVVVWYWIQSGKFMRNMVKALGLVGAVLVGAALIKTLLTVFNVAYLDYIFLGKPKVLPAEHLGPSIQVTLRQLTELQGASIFGADVRLHNLLLFINFAILVVGVLGLLVIILTVSKSYRRKKDIAGGNDFIFVVLAVSYFVILLEYVFSGFAVINFNGQIIDFMNTRYLTLLPLLTIVGVVWLLARYFNELRFFIIVGVVAVVAIGLYSPAVEANYALLDQNKPVPSKASVDELIGYLTANKVDTIVTDFWYGPPIRFWSSDQISYAPQIGCNQPIPFDSRQDWYKPQPGKKTALIIDRGGLNFGYWSCSDEDLVKIYGEPVSKAATKGIRPGDTVNVWIYNYDVRERLAPFPSK